MRAHDAVGFFAQRHRDGGDRQLRGVRGQQRVGGCSLADLGHQALLELEDLRHGLDHDLGVLDRDGQVGGGLDVLADARGLLGGEALLANEAGEAVVDRGQRLAQRLLGDVAERDLVPAHGGQLGNAVAHDAGTDHRDAHAALLSGAIKQPFGR